MKLLNQLAIIFLSGIIVSSCKKDEFQTSPLASLKIVNTFSGSPSVKVGSRSEAIYFDGQVSLNAGSTDLYIWPEGDSLHPYLTYPKFRVNAGDVYSLFICGDTSAPEGILIKENLPYRTDSSAGIRFINLFANSSPLTITLSATPTVIEVSDLAYKQYTDFKSYPGHYNSSYTFEVRDVTTPAPLPPLTTYTLDESSVPRFKNITFVILNYSGFLMMFPTYH